MSKGSGVAGKGDGRNQLSSRRAAPAGELAGDWARHKTTRAGTAYRAWAGPRRAETCRGALSGLFFSGLELGLELLLDVGGHRVVVAEFDGVGSLAPGYGLELGLIVVELA